jgi:hypothetical protein
MIVMRKDIPLSLVSKYPRLQFDYLLLATVAKNGHDIGYAAPKNCWIKVSDKYAKDWTIAIGWSRQLCSRTSEGPTNNRVDKCVRKKEQL